MLIIRKRAYARAGLLGNPLDGYHGRTISLIVRNFSAEVVLYEWYSEAELAQARLHFRGSAKLLDSLGHASLNAAERTNLALRLLAASGLICLVPNHTNNAIVAGKGRFYYTVFAIRCP